MRAGFQRGLRAVLFIMLGLGAAAAHADTAIYFDSSPGDYIGGGVKRILTTADGSISATSNPWGRPGVEVFFNGTTWWTLFFTGPQGRPFVAGNYENATRAAVSAPNGNGIDISGDGRGCNTIKGRFTVREVEFGPNNDVVKFAADFVQYCEGSGPALRGAVRYNSAIPLLPPDPVAVAGAGRTVDEGALVTLDAGNSYDADGTIVAYAWRQLSGPSVTLIASASPTPQFIAPDVPSGGADVVLELEVTDNDGRKDTDTVNIHVRDSADPRSIIYFDSAPGDYIGGGVKRTLTTDDGVITAGSDPWGRSGVAVNFSGAAWWNLVFNGPAGAPFVAGNYENAIFPPQAPSRNGIDISGDGRGCPASGRFTVREVEFGSSNTVLKFAADFVQTCDGSTSPLRGVVRFNSAIPIFAPEPVAVAGAGHTIDEGSQVNLDGGNSYDADGTIVAYAWRQVSGPAATLTAPSSTSTQFTAPAVGPGGADVVFELEVTDNDGGKDTDTVTIHVRDDTDARSVIYFDSSPGDYIGGGIERTLTTDDGAITASAFGPSGVSVRFVGPSWWNLWFTGPQGLPLAVGNYENATDSPSNSPNRNGISITGEGRGCSAIGRFTVREIEFGPSNDVVKLAVDFVQRCGSNAPPLRGVVRYNSAIPLMPPDPVAVAGAGRVVDEGVTVTLDGGNSYDADGTIVAYAWRQVSGPGVTLVAPASPTPQFTAAAVSAGGADVVLELEVTDNDGRKDTDIVTVHIRDASDPRTLIYFDSSPGDYVGGGVKRTLTPEDGLITAVPNGPWGVSVQFAGTTFWNLSFSSRQGQPLVAGNYENATDTSFVGPYISVTGDGRGCSASGRFTVHEIEFGASNNVLKLALDFVQRCGPAAPPLRGAVRINSAVAVLPPVPVAVAGAGHTVDEGTVVALDGGNSYDADGTIVAYAWRQVSGPGVTLVAATSPTTQFTAPAVNAGGADVVLELEVTDNDGQKDTDTVTIHIRDTADARSVIYFDSSPGDYIGGGVKRTLTVDDGAITASSNASLAGVYVHFAGTTWWDLSFSGPRSQRLVAGNYENATDSPFAGNLISISGDGRGCSATGRFTVREIEFGPTSDVVKFAADFVQRCGATAPPLRGSVRINSAIPILPPDPVAVAGARRTVDEGALVVLDGNNSYDADGTITTYKWRRVSGPVLTLSGASTAIAQFSAPNVPAGGADIVLELEVTDNDGRKDTDTITIHVRDSFDPRSAIYFDSPIGDYVGGGVKRTLTTDDGTITAAAYFGGGVAVRFAGSTWWDLEFAGPNGQPFVAGTYENATRAPFKAPNGNGINIYGDGRGCNTITGRFIVLEVQFGPNNDVVKFAADFEQSCEGFMPPLRGSVRFNSGIPISINSTTQFTSTTAVASGVATFSMSGGGSACTLVNPHWIGRPPGTGEVPPTLPGPAVAFPHGMLAFATNACTPGAAVTFTLKLPLALPPGFVYWKYGPTPGNPASHWYVLPSTIVGDTITFTIVDGGLGDDDLTANGAIVDPGGAGNAVAALPPGPTTVVQIPVMSPPLLALAALLIALIAAAQLPWPRGKHARPRR